MNNGCTNIALIVCAVGAGILMASIFPCWLLVCILAVAVVIISIMCLK